MKNSDISYYLFTLVNISEDSGLNGEHEYKLFKSYDKALDYMEEAIENEIKAYSENHKGNDVEVERVDDDIVNLWLNKENTEAVLYSISEIQPI